MAAIIDVSSIISLTKFFYACDRVDQDMYFRPIMHEQMGEDFHLESKIDIYFGWITTVESMIIHDVIYYDNATYNENIRRVNLPLGIQGILSPFVFDADKAKVSAYNRFCSASEKILAIGDIEKIICEFDNMFPSNPLKNRAAKWHNATEVNEFYAVICDILSGEETTNSYFADNNFFDRLKSNYGASDDLAHRYFNRKRVSFLSHLARLLYYIEIQKSTGINLIVHPAKEFFLEQKKGIAGSILNLFLSEIDGRQAETAAKWLGERSVSFKLPPIIRRILSIKSDKGCRFSDAILYLRDSKEARRFRDDVKLLEDAIQKNDIDTINDIVSELECYSKRWREGLRMDPFGYERVVKIAIPMIGGPSIDIKINIPRFFKKPGEGIAIFAHKVLTG